MSFKTVGITEAETHSDGRINVVLWREALYAITEDATFEKFIKLLSAAIRHELVHREQTSRSKTMCHQQEPKRFVQKMEPWAQYYSDPHELGAMAHEIIESTVQARMSKETMLKELAKPFSNTLFKLSMRYGEVVGGLVRDSLGGHHTMVMRRLKKNIYQVLCN